jgi:hypothetical protein
MARSPLVIGSVTSAPASTDAVAGFADSPNGGSDYAISAGFSAAANGVLSGTLTGLDSASHTAAATLPRYLVGTNAG